MCGLTIAFILVYVANCESDNCAGLIEYVDGCVCESIERKCTAEAQEDSFIKGAL